MGDGIEPFIRGFVSTIGSGLEGLVHGGIDSATEMPGMAHNALAYGPAAASGLFVATSQYGLWEPSDKVAGAVFGAGFAAGATFLGYWTGRVVVAGVKKVVYN